MAILEYNWRLSDNQQVTTGTRTSSDVVDLQNLRDIGEGTPIYAHFQITESGFAGEADTLRIEVVASSSSSLTNPFLLSATPDLLETEVTLYSQFFLPVGFFRRGEDSTIYAFDGSPASTANGLQYIGARYVNGLSSGRITARLSLDTSTTPRIYPASTNT